MASGRRLAIFCCTCCRAPIKREALGLDRLMPCTVCGKKLGAEVYPALLSDPATAAPSMPEPATAEEAGCFFHPAKRAVAACEMCGRFLCALCDVELHGKHLCSGCISSGRKKGKLAHLESQRTVYSYIALLLAILPMFTVWLTIFTAPLAVYVVIRYWNRPGSLVHGSKVIFVMAFILAAAQILGWIALLLWALYG